jgi:hypothetical protein
MFRSRLSVLLVLALVLVNIQCVAFCASAFCDDSAKASAGVPPCHRHQHTPVAPENRDSAACHHPLVPSVGVRHGVTASTPVNELTASLPVVPLFALPFGRDTQVLATRTPSPPGSGFLTTLVLKI